MRSHAFGSWGPPENEVPVGVPASVLLGRSDGVAVALVAIRAYSSGFQLDLALRLRTAPAADDLHHLFMGRHRRGADPADLFLFGLEFADGRSVTNVESRPGPPVPAALVDDPAGVRPSIGHGGGGGGGRTYDQRMWVAPLPPAGPLTLVVAWARMGISERKVLLDGQAIAEAGARATELWPWEPEQDDEPAEPEPPALPPGWFADRARPDRPDRPDRQR